MTSQQIADNPAYKRTPLVREVLADLDTPLSTFLKLAAAPYSYLFESVQGGEKWGRYSIIGLPCRTIIKITGNEVSIEVDGKVNETFSVEDPLEWIEQYQGRFEVLDRDGLPRFTGGLVGYFGYDTIRYIEPKLQQCPNPDTLNTPDILLMVSDEIVVFDIADILGVKPEVFDANALDGASNVQFLIASHLVHNNIDLETGQLLLNDLVNFFRRSF